MQYKLSVGEYNITSDLQYTDDILNENKNFPFLTIGKDSYIEDATSIFTPNNELLYNLQIGRYSSLASGINFLIDLNHDYKRPSQGRISKIPYQKPTEIKRAGQIIIMNDCWIGQNVTILSGVTIKNGAVVAADSVVTKDVPEYAIVGGNPAKIIGYRFSPKQIEDLRLIQWWNWDNNKIIKNADLLYGNVDNFINKHIEEAKYRLSTTKPINILSIEKSNNGKDLRYLYIPDFEQDYPTYPQVIEAFIKSYSNTNTELLLYIEEDEFLNTKLELLNNIFEIYEDANCYINLHIDSNINILGLMGQVDAYITNRGLFNIQYMDAAYLNDIPIYSCVSLPIFEEKTVSSFYKEKNKSDDNLTSPTLEKTIFSSIKNIQNTLLSHQENLENFANIISQLSTNQYAMNQSIGNLKYEILADFEKPKYPIVESGQKAIELILTEKKSMCRFGDGEFAVIAGVDRQRFQRADKKLALRLKEVLQSNNPSIILCIADVYGNLSKYNDDCQYNIRAYMTEEVRRQHYELLDFNRTYYDTYVTRPYASYLDNNTDAPKKRFEHLKKIWDHRNLLIIEGEKTRMGVGNDLFDNALSITRILGPAENAFDKYDEILTIAKKQPKELLVLIAMGATATVLSYDLTLEGYQALDIGHIDIEYEWMLAGKRTKTEVPHKYNNEVKNGYIVENIKDEAYEKQIIARLY